MLISNNEIEYLSKKCCLLKYIPYNTIVKEYDSNVSIKAKILEEEGKLCSLFNNNSIYAIHYKSFLFENENNDINTFFEKKYKSFYNQIKVNEPFYKVLVRISSNPWSIHSHFDLDNNYLFVLYGSKQILIFDLDDFTENEEKELLNDTVNFKIKETEIYLKQREVSYETYKLEAGKLFYIPSGKYHKVENDIKFPFTIMLNCYTKTKNDNNLNEKFYTFWGNLTPNQ